MNDHKHSGIQSNHSKSGHGGNGGKSDGGGVGGGGSCSSSSVGGIWGKFIFIALTKILKYEIKSIPYSQLIVVGVVVVVVVLIVVVLVESEVNSFL